MLVVQKRTDTTKIVLYAAVSVGIHLTERKEEGKEMYIYTSITDFKEHKR